MHQAATETFYDRIRLEDAGRRAALIAWMTGAAGVVLTFVLALVPGAGAGRVLLSWLFALLFYLTLALGGLFFVVVGHATRAGWFVVVRRLGEATGATIPALFVLSIPVLLGLGHLYPWAAAHEVSGSKATWLSPAFFTIRLIVYFAVWTWTALWYLRRSTEQDATGDPGLTVRMERRAGFALVAYSLTVTFASFDLVMSRDPEWYSTILGVYVYAGAVVGFFGLLAVLVRAFQAGGRLVWSITPEHDHDIGKLIFAFIVFWAYIAFSQYMLIWYGNLPEETVWYARRQAGGWVWVSLTLLFGHFLVPFVLLLARAPKRRPRVLAVLGGWVVLMHLIDVYWLVMPESSPGRVPLHLADLTSLVAIGGICAAVALEVLRRRTLLPVRDPRLGESLRFENV